MKKATYILIFVFTFSCAKQEKKLISDELVRNILVLIILNDALSDSCRDYSGGTNELFYTDYYEGSFKADTNEYTNIVIGNSSMDYSTRLTDYLSSDSQSVAVAGNTLCDMQEQLPAINSTSPDWVVIGTLGGNDVLKKISNGNIAKSGKALFSAIRLKFPSTKIAGIGIHPTRVDYANTNRTVVNDALKPELDCYINPDEFFTIEDDGKASTSNLLENDTIHYNSTVSYQIKDKLESQCGITL